MIKSFLKLDWILLTAVILLLGLSLSVLYPISYSGGPAGQDSSHFFRQLEFAGMGLLAFFVFSFIDYRIFKGSSTFLFLLGIFLLCAVLLVGKVIRGTTGWIGFAGFHLQPVEIFKVILVVALAKYLSVNARTIENIKHIFISMVPVGLATILILKQPDLGSALVVLGVWLGLLLISGTKKKHLLLLVLIGALIAFASWGYFLKDYQKDRVRSLFYPTSDPLGAGYNVIQSTVAVGSGGLWGKGLGHGSQSQLNFLPEKHTDFIFAVVSEELGLGGALFILALFTVIIYRLLNIARGSRDNFGKLLVGGFAIIIFIQALVNVGMNIGIMPVAGIPLPLLSYGGSSLVSILLALGIAENVYRKSHSSFS